MLVWALARGVTSQRLALVRNRIRFAVEAVPPGPVRTMSIYAGDGWDLVGAFAAYPRRSDVQGLLVEIDQC